MSWFSYALLAFDYECTEIIKGFKGAVKGISEENPLTFQEGVFGW